MNFGPAIAFQTVDCMLHGGCDRGVGPLAGYHAFH